MTTFPGATWRPPMYQLNSEPKPSLMGMSPLSLLRVALGSDGDALMDALGIEEISCEKLDLTVEKGNRARRERKKGGRG